MDSRQGSGCAWLMLLSLVVVCTLSATTHAQNADAGQPTFEQRLWLINITDQILRGAQPEPADYAVLAKEKGVKRIICLLAEDEVPADCRDTAQAAGIAYTFHPIDKNPTLASEERRFDRAEVMAIVNSLREPGEGVTYIHDDYGRDRTGVVHFAYRYFVDKKDYATALLEAAARGFDLPSLLGYQEDLKLLALESDTLPELKVMPISNSALTGRGARVTVPGVRLNYKKQGDGPPLYALHGGPGETHMTMRPFLDALANDFTLVYFDQRGSGLSSRPQFSEAYTIDRLVEDLENLRISFGHEKISLIGQSSGGVLAARYALAHPDRMDKIVIVSSWASAEEFKPTAVLGLALMSKKDQDSLKEVVKTLREERRDFNDDELAEMQKSFYPAQFFGRLTPEFRDDWNRRASLSALAYNALSREFFGRNEPSAALDLRPRLGEIKNIPTLVIAGKFDVITPPGIVKTFADGIPSARFEVFEKSGHYPFIEENSRFIKMVTEFLQAK